MLRFQEPFTVEGVWWLPDTPEHQISGSFTLDQDQGGSLSLSGMLRALVESMNAASDERHTIHGFTKKGQRVTLLDCFNKQRSLNFPGIGTETYHVNLAAIGLHIVDAEQEIFTKSYLRFDGIEKWLGHRPFDVVFNPEERQISVTTRSSKEQPFATLPEQLLTIGADIRTNPLGETEVAVISEANLIAEPSEAKSLNWHFNNAWKLQALASLCTGYHLPMLSLRLKGPEEEVAPGRKERASVDILASILYPTAAKRSADPPIFSGPELLSLSPAAIARWFGLYEELDQVLHLFATVVADKNLFVNVRFLLAVQALEAFHRTTEPQPLMEEAEHQALQKTLLSAMPSATPKRMKEKLRTTLQFTNEPSLRQRLRAIFNGIEDRYGNVPAGFPVKQFVGSVVDTRNYYTHYVEGLASKALDGSGMYFEGRRIALLLTVLLLEQIGIPSADIPPHLERHREYWQLWQNPGRPH